MHAHVLYPWRSQVTRHGKLGDRRGRVGRHHKDQQQQQQEEEEDQSIKWPTFTSAAAEATWKEERFLPDKDGLDRGPWLLQPGWQTMELACAITGFACHQPILDGRAHK
jgi:hypothetical protein